MIAPFAKLRGVTPERLDATLADFTDEDWDRLETGYLDPIALDVTEHLDPLELAEDADRVLLLCRIYARSIARNPEV